MSRISIAEWVWCYSILLLSYGCTSSKEKPSAVNSPVTVASPDTIKVSSVSPDRLVGRWLRPDGGYILEIRSASADGKLDVGYFNPKSIHVGRAEWVEKDGSLYVLAELQDVNYPGSTYGLEYMVAQDRLIGTYYQAVEKSTYEVAFVREK